MDRSERPITFSSKHKIPFIEIFTCSFTQDRYAYNYTRPVMDSTTLDWFGIQGREMNGWTVIQFRRALDTCDTMDVPIRVCHLFHSRVNNHRCVNFVFVVRHRDSDLCIWSR